MQKYSKQENICNLHSTPPFDILISDSYVVTYQLSNELTNKKQSKNPKQKSGNFAPPCKFQIKDFQLKSKCWKKENWRTEECDAFCVRKPTMCPIPEEVQSENKCSKEENWSGTDCLYFCSMIEDDEYRGLISVKCPLPMDVRIATCKKTGKCGTIACTKIC